MIHAYDLEQESQLVLVTRYMHAKWKGTNTKLAPTPYCVDKSEPALR